MTRRDQAFREQPTFFSDVVTNAVSTTFVSEGKRSRDETFVQDVLPELTDREKEVYVRIVAEGRSGITIDEISEKTGRPANAFSGRVTNLVEKNRVRYTNDRRPTRSGSTAAVIVAVEFLDQPQLPSFVPSHSTTTPSLSMQMSPETMPDQVTCITTPLDQNGQKMQADRRYLFGNVHVKCFEDDAGNLLFQPCTRLGNPAPGSTPQFVRDLRKDTRPFLLVGPQFE